METMQTVEKGRHWRGGNIWKGGDPSGLGSSEFRSNNEEKTKKTQEKLVNRTFNLKRNRPKRSGKKQRGGTRPSVLGEDGRSKNK